jgi:hypothetical protein
METHLQNAGSESERKKQLKSAKIIFGHVSKLIIVV